MVGLKGCAVARVSIAYARGMHGCTVDHRQIHGFVRNVARFGRTVATKAHFYTVRTAQKHEGLKVIFYSSSFCDALTSGPLYGRADSSFYFSSSMSSLVDG